MFCGKCGAEVKNGAAFCPNCGEHLAGQYVIKSSKNGKQKNPISGKLLKIVLPVVAVGIIAVVATVLTYNNSGYEKVVENFYKAVETQDVQLMKTTLAQYWIDYHVADYYSDEHLNENIEDIIADVIDECDCGDNIEILSCTVTREKKATKEDLSFLKDNIYDWYAYYVYDENEFESSIKDACVVTARVTAKGGDDVIFFTSKMLLIKENGKWKISMGRLDNSFYSNR